MTSNTSPRTSAETAAQSPTSPVFIHSLTQRLRKGSTASRASSQSSDAASHAEVDRSQDARSAKRYLLSIIKDDWEYPINPAQQDDPKVQREASGYRLREESLSEYESEDRRKWAGHEDDPYRFETPDDVSALVERKKARRRRLLEQELSWNDGLRTWTLRRDAWTGAVPVKPTTKSHIHGSKALSKERLHRESSDSTGASSTSAPSWPLPTPNNATESQDPSDNVIPAANAEQLEHPDGPYLPIYPPLLPASHTLRSRIKPTAYPTIYSKVVVLNLTPNVPIPLTHMIGALVNGWKSEGNWPPQPMEVIRMGSRRKTKKSESAFQKWKREQEEKRNATLTQADEVQWEQEEQEHKGVRKSISSAMKKMLGSSTSVTPEADADQDLENLGLVFEADPEREAADAEALKNGHV